MGDLKSKKWIVIKGVLFLVILILSAVCLYFLAPQWVTILLILMLAWSAARLYYFLFYVLGQYVDPNLKYSGLMAMLKQILKNRRRP